MMTEQEKISAATVEYQDLAHAMQTGVAYSDPAFGGEPGTVSNQLKHLRVGVNSSLVNSSALGKLLISKGIITELEYVEAMRDGMREEVERYTEEVRQRFSNPSITLG